MTSILRGTLTALALTSTVWLAATRAAANDFETCALGHKLFDLRHCLRKAGLTIDAGDSPGAPPNLAPNTSGVEREEHAQADGKKYDEGS